MQVKSTTNPTKMIAPQIKETTRCQRVESNFEITLFRSAINIAIIVTAINSVLLSKPIIIVIPLLNCTGSDRFRHSLLSQDSNLDGESHRRQSLAGLRSPLSVDASTNGKLGDFRQLLHMIR